MIVFETDVKVVSTILFSVAVVHTFLTSKIRQLANRFANGSIAENLFHLLGEVEIVFGFWAAAFICYLSYRFGSQTAAEYLNQVNYTEARFVFVILAICTTRPILDLARSLIHSLSKAVPIKGSAAVYFVTLVVGPLLGSLITEPAAMAVTAMLIANHFERSTNSNFKYCTLALLFVNVSIGGTLSNFAAPPVLMVAQKWDWDSLHLLRYFGWKAALSILICTAGTTYVFRREFASAKTSPTHTKEHSPWWVSGIHLVFLSLTVYHSHHSSFFIPLFLFFLGWCLVSKEYQDEVDLKQGLLVGFFLGGLVTLGGLQDWWLKPLLENLSSTNLFWGATALTAVTDNAAITYLGTLVPDISDEAKYALVSGAVTGGGLTVIANAPNPAGYSILNRYFGDDGIRPLSLFLCALPYTLVAAVFFLNF